MPFDLESLSYAPFRRFKELASPYEMSRLRSVGFQQSLTKAIPKYTVIDENYFSSYKLQRIFTDESCLPLINTRNQVTFSTHEEISSAWLEKIIMQPKEVILEEFNFHQSCFLFSHSCRKFVTSLWLRISDSYTFTGGELDMVVKAFPNLKKLLLKRNDNNTLRECIDYFIDSHFENFPKMLVQFSGADLSSIEDCKEKLAFLFKKAGPTFTLQLKFVKATAAISIDELLSLGYCVEAHNLFVTDLVYLNIHKGDCQCMLKFKYCRPSVILNDYSMLKVYNKRKLDKFTHPPNDDSFLDPSPHQKSSAIREIMMSCEVLNLTKEKGSKLDRRHLNNLHFELKTLRIHDCYIDDDVLEFTRPFCHQVKKLEFENVLLTNDESVFQLSDAFPAVEELHFYKVSASALVEALICNDLSNTKIIDYKYPWSKNYLLNFLLANPNKMIELFKRAHSSCRLILHQTKNLTTLDKFRKLGFSVEIFMRENCSTHIYNGIQTHIRMLGERQEKVTIHPDRIVLFYHTEIFACSPKVQLVADRIILENAQSSFYVDTKVRNRLIMRPTVIKVKQCVDRDFIKFAKRFTDSLEHLDLRQCQCQKTHCKMLKKLIRKAFPKLVKIWDIGDT